MISTFIPTLWSARLLAHLDKSLVLGNLVNTDYQGEIANAGDTVKINQIGDIVVKDYKKTENISYDEVDGTPTELRIDQMKYFAFNVDDVDAAQANIPLLDRALERASYSLRDTLDQRIASHAADAGATITMADIDAPETAYESMIKASIALDEANVQRDGRWIVIPPWFYGLLQKDTRFVGTGSMQAEARLMTGQVGQAAGFSIYMSNNLSTVKATGVVSVMAGTNSAITMARQILKTEALRREGSFKDAVRGLLVYGSTVVQPKALVTLKVNPKAEAAG